MDARSIERVYDRYARFYDRVFGGVFEPGRVAAAEGLDVRPGDRVLEVGIGTGLALARYPRSCQLVGIDVSEGMLTRAARQVQAQGLRNVELLRMDAQAMAFADDSFDVVVAAYVMTVIPDFRRALSEMARVCRPAGRILIINHFTNGNRLVRMVERAISPICERLGWRSDLAVDDLLVGAPLRLVRNTRLAPLGMWHLLDCVNAKTEAPSPAA
ncbi:MAG: methyltransferase domain-containing protein [Burkholderiales bacterium]|nr:methyltransferase domain-containing protein [Burkholderiales bacterium]